jgi:hypothetical protein
MHPNIPRSINDTSETTPVIPKVKESKEIVKFFNGCIGNTDRMFVVSTLHGFGISLREREQVFKKFGFADQEIAMDFIYLFFYLYSSGLLVG